jgi:hypothetical protein
VDTVGRVGDWCGGSKRYWIAIGVLAAFVGLVVLVPTSPVQDQPAVFSQTVTPPADSTTTTTTTTMPGLPLIPGDRDWLGEPIPEVLAGQVVDVDDDGEPDVALFGAAESPMISTIDDGDPDARAQELVAASERIAELESDVSALEQSRSTES